MHTRMLPLLTKLGYATGRYQRMTYWCAWTLRPPGRTGTDPSCFPSKTGRGLVRPQDSFLREDKGLGQTLEVRLPGTGLPTPTTPPRSTQRTGRIASTEWRGGETSDVGVVLLPVIQDARGDEALTHTTDEVRAQVVEDDGHAGDVAVAGTVGPVGPGPGVGGPVGDPRGDFGGSVWVSSCFESSV